MDVAFDELLQQLNGHSFWRHYLSDAARPMSAIGIHVAIFSEPFLSLVFSGQKTIESRFSRNRCAPYGEIGEGDILLIKEVAGPIRGLSLARQAWCYDLTSERLDDIKDRFSVGLCADEQFWASRADALYATLIELDATVQIEPIRYNKRDRRGWVSLRSRQRKFNFV